MQVIHTDDETLYRIPVEKGHTFALAVLARPRSARALILNVMYFSEEVRYNRGVELNIGTNTDAKLCVLLSHVVWPV